MTLVRMTLVRARRAEGLVRAHEAACETLCGTWIAGYPCRAMRGGPRRAVSGITLFRFLRGGGTERWGPCTWSTFPVMHVSVRSASVGIVVALRMKNAVLQRLV